MDESVLDPTSEADKREARARAIAEQRAAYIAGLREFADALEAHPEIPIAPWSPMTIFASLVDVPDGEVNELEVMAAAARAIPGRVEKQDSGDYFGLRREFGGFTYELLASRGAVCERKKVGTKKETKIVPVSEETKEVEVEVDVFEWDCKPVLRDASTD